MSIENVFGDSARPSPDSDEYKSYAATMLLCAGKIAEGAESLFSEMRKRFGIVVTHGELYAMYKILAYELGRTIKEDEIEASDALFESFLLMREQYYKDNCKDKKGA